MQVRFTKTLSFKREHFAASPFATENDRSAVLSDSWWGYPSTLQYPPPLVQKRIKYQTVHFVTGADRPGTETTVKQLNRMTLCLVPKGSISNSNLSLTFFVSQFCICFERTSYLTKFFSEDKART